MKAKPEAELPSEWADVLPPQFYGKPELRRAYFDFIANMLISKCHPETVLDIGCGTGDLTIAFQRLSVNATGMDISKRALFFASQSGSGFFCADIDKRWPVEDNTVDIVTAHEVLEHVHDPTYCIAEARRVLKPGGSVFVTTPTPIPLVSPLIRFMLRHEDCDVHVSEHSRSWWLNEFRRAGFSYFEELTPLLKKWRNRSGFFWELPNPERLFLRLGYPGRWIINELHSLFSRALLFREG
jgi:ubiquinone/menaquinone biosynthesis C-methylase UbiE